MSKLKHVEGIGLIDLSAVTFIGYMDNMLTGNVHTYSFEYICDGVMSRPVCDTGARDDLIKAIEEHNPEEWLSDLLQKHRSDYVSLADKEEFRRSEFLKQKEALKAEADLIYEDVLRQKVLRGRQGSAG